MRALFGVILGLMRLNFLSFLAGELLKIRLGSEMVHVPYKEGSLALSDVMGGQVHFMFYHPAAVMPHIKSDKLRALGVSSDLIHQSTGDKP